MQKQLLYQNYSTSVLTGRQLLLSFDVEYRVDPNDPVRWVDAFVDTLADREVSPTRHSLRGRRTIYTDRLMLKICLMAAVLAQNSSRQIEDLCRHDIRFLWLLGSLAAPDHTTIARYHARIRSGLGGILMAMNHWLLQQGLITSDHLFIDGTKIEAVSNRYTFVWKKAVMKHLERLLGQLPDLFLRMNDELASEAIQDDEIAFALEHPQETLEILRETITRVIHRQQISLVYGKGQRKHDLQRLLEEVERSLARVIRYEQQIAVCGPHRNSFSKTDPDATFMRMKDDHMRNGQLKPAYNLTIGVNSEFILWVDLSQDRTDYARLPLVLDAVEKIFGHPVHAVVADAGYDCTDNYRYCQDKAILPYIKPQCYEAEKKKAYWTNPKNWKSMRYDPVKDAFHCLGGRRLDFQRIRNDQTRQGMRIEKRIYECTDCSGCTLKDRCTTSRGNRKIYWDRSLEEWRKVSQGLIQSPEGILLRLNRSIQAEGCFASLKSHRGRDRLRHVGIDKCLAEMQWEALGHNVRKLVRKLQRKDPRQYLHACQAAVA